MKYKLKCWTNGVLFIRLYSDSVYTEDWECTPCPGREMLLGISIFGGSVGLERQKVDTWGDKLKREGNKSDIKLHFF